MQKVKDYRKRSDYELTEILMGGISLFLFKEGSRNAFNNDRREKDFVSNYRKLFGMELPHMDTVDDVFRVISEEELEKFKTSMIRELLEKKVLQKHRILFDKGRTALKPIFHFLNRYIYFVPESLRFYIYLGQL